MVFSSLTFLYFFLPLNFIFYFISKNKTYRDWVLIIFSLSFYAWGEPIWVTILVFSGVMDYFHGLWVEKYRGKWQSRAALLSSVIVNLTLLGFFKYWGFIIENLNYLAGTSIPIKEFGLPIGISFYTFQTISYVIDVYRGEVKAQRSFYKLLLFVSLFHQLVAGPIVRYQDIARQIEKRTISVEGFSSGVTRFVTGLGKKVILANHSGAVAEMLIGGGISQLSILGAWLGIIMFAFQIYFDFSGYSDMAIGLGRMFGFTYKENFNYPYISRSATEFWRRWHISLGSFFRDYVYIPLGGNVNNHVRNLFIVWFLTGLWHGASWNFIIWGLYYGLLIFLEKAFLNKVMSKLPRYISHIYLIGAVLVGWVFFYYTDLSRAFELLGVMSGLAGTTITNPEFYIHFKNNALFLVVAIIACTPVIHNIKGYLLSDGGPLDDSFSFSRELFISLINIAILGISTVLLVGKTYNPFLYFRF